MNNRSLTRGDLIVIGAAVLLLVASFLDFYEFKGVVGGESDSRNAWSNFWFPALFSIYLAGVIAAGLTAGSRFVPAHLKVLGLTLDQWGLTLAIFTAWTALWTLFANPLGAEEALDMGIGQILGAIFAVGLAVAAVLNQLLAPLKLPISGGPSAPASPYGQQPQAGYGYPGAQQPGMQQPGAQQPQGGYGYPGAQQQPGAQQPYGQQQPQQAAQPAAQQQPQAAAPDPNFQPFWFAVPVARPLFAEDGSQTPVAELAPGTWYLAVEQRGQALVAQTQDNRRGILQDTSGIQRG
ncbi:DUF5336 domain-containing protein [Streptomyces sp. XM4193]|uniref:DUF5336 domain-containing protein n=1 Tax=Streptomyces sp. XM4193 TaxID=2929782 RepID=UPI001FFA2E6E|nr:DUF5336 domain-containing protein [Streptomyces sp. XM4193]MCK1796128.1 DUF5336 domain-containing protein [Streptomyces sp. XM4193]